MNFNDAAIVSAKGSDYRIHFWYMNRNDAVNTMKNFTSNEKCGLLLFLIIYYYIEKLVI